MNDWSIVARQRRAKPSLGIALMKIISATSSTSVCATMMAGNSGTAPGTVKASGSTTSELRVAALKAIDLPASASSLANQDAPQPSSGATMPAVLAER
ncbi:MAG: guanyl-specific ribonuclease Sa [Afipia broomeae]